MEQNTEKTFSFSLIGIKTDQFAIIHNTFDLSRETRINSSAQIHCDVPSKQLGLSMNFEFIQDEKLLIKLVVSCFFQIEEKTWANRIEENHIVFPKTIINHFAMITTGTARGILFAKTEGSLLSKIHLPLINVSDLFAEDISFPIPVNG